MEKSQNELNDSAAKLLSGIVEKMKDGTIDITRIEQDDYYDFEAEPTERTGYKVTFEVEL